VGEHTPGLEIAMLGGNCPVQAEGTINGKPFYFRARGEHWSIGVGGDEVLDPEWSRSEQWGDSRFAAGWMSEEVAREIIETCAREYIAESSSGAPIEMTTAKQDGDLVERLRGTYTSLNNPPSDGLPDGAGVVLEAADEIERLRSALQSAESFFDGWIWDAMSEPDLANEAKGVHAEILAVLNPPPPSSRETEIG
jgi:hypothetical protein